jgi:hypothetical protein
MALLARTFRPEQVSIVKATDACTNLLANVLGRAASARALFLHVDLEDFLGAVLGDEERRGFVRLRLDDLSALLPEDPVLHASDRGDWSDATQASLLWALQMRVYASRRGDPKRLVFPELRCLRDPARAARAVADSSAWTRRRRVSSGPSRRSSRPLESHTPFTLKIDGKAAAAIALHRGEIRSRPRRVSGAGRRAGLPQPLHPNNSRAWG